jgi:hypothetical protein
MPGDGQPGSPGRTRGIKGCAASALEPYIGKSAAAPRPWSIALRTRGIVIPSLVKAGWYNRNGVSKHRLLHGNCTDPYRSRRAGRRRGHLLRSGDGAQVIDPPIPHQQAWSLQTEPDGSDVVISIQAPIRCYASHSIPRLGPRVWRTTRSYAARCQRQLWDLGCRSSCWWPGSSLVRGYTTEAAINLVE